ncbi:MAG: DNA gyrase subunit A, partial [Candidatus Omnitrophica bacterium]|nr:DNA gyrase subunit A [Candidatus Omnitrophota bacterium]
MTAMGVTKRCELGDFDAIRKSGIAAINLHKEDELISVRLTGGNVNIFAATKLGKAIHFPEIDVRCMGRGAAGVRGMNLEKGDEIIGMEAVEKDDYLLTVTEHGFAKRSKAGEYRLQSRGGKGITNLKITDRNGKAIGMRAVSDHDDLMVMSSGGMIVRVGVKDLRATGRVAQGVKVINLKAGDKVATMTCIEAEDAPEGSAPQPPAAE